MSYEILKIVDLDVTERDELAAVVKQAADVNGYLHVEVRRSPSEFARVEQDPRD